MRDIVLLIAVIAYMIGGYFVAGKIGDFIDENYKGYEYDIENDDKIDEIEDLDHEITISVEKNSRI